MIIRPVVSGVVRPSLAALTKGGGAPWRVFGGSALRVTGQAIRVLSQPLVVVASNG
jgi:hypothetical protein